MEIGHYHRVSSQALSDTKPQHATSEMTVLKSKMLQYSLYCATLLMFVAVSSHDQILSRRKRYITFPEGSVVTFLADLFEYVPVAGDNIFTFGLDVDMSWPLPNGTQLYQLGREEERDFKRRERRDLYLKLEDFFSTAGLDGRACVLKTLCEVTQRLGTQRGESGIVEELLKVFFIMPTVPSQNKNHYDHANHLGHFDDNECAHLFPRCTISLIDLVFGSSNVPQSIPHL